MEAVEPGSQGQQDQTSRAGGAGRQGRRRGRRRVVAPPTSGQSHEVESAFTDPFLAPEPDDSAGSSGSTRRPGATAPDSTASDGAESAPAAPGETLHGATVRRDAVAAAPLSAHEAWILSQRPPHWG